MTTDKNNKKKENINYMLYIIGKKWTWCIPKLFQ